jgi:hypothetical protein
MKPLPMLMRVTSVINTSTSAAHANMAINSLWMSFNFIVYPQRRYILHQQRRADNRVDEISSFSSYLIQFRSLM